MSTEDKHILTQAEALAALHVDTADEVPNLEMLLDGTDDGIKSETGYDWALDNPINPTAKLAASILLVCLYDGTEVPKFYWQKIVQLDAEAKELIGGGS